MKTNALPLRCLSGAAALFLVTSSLSQAADSAAAADSRAAVAQDRPISEHSQLARGDRRFVEKVAKIGLEESSLSQLAVERASREEVRAFARDVISDHEKANAELSQLASNKGLVLPVAERENLNHWTKKTGKDFDEDYLEKIISGHKDVVDMMESRGTKAEDSDVAAFARNHLATMQEHLRKAKELKKLVD
jgi:putative membrane protein